MNILNGQKVELLPKPPVKGFTLMELMVVLAILSILAAVGAPAFQSTINRNAQITGVNVIIAGVSNARTAAATRRRQVVLMPNANNDWSTGVQTRLDNTVGEVISVADFADSGVTISSTAALNRIDFDDLGRANPPNSAFLVCNTTTNRALRVEVNYFGRARANRDQNDLLVYEDCP